MTENKLSFKRFIKECLVFFFDKLSESKNMFYIKHYTVEVDSSLPKVEKDFKSNVLLKNNKGKETSLPGSESIKEKNSSRRIQKYSDRNTDDSKEKSLQPAYDSDGAYTEPKETENKPKDTSIKSTNNSPKYPSRIFFGESLTYDGNSVIFNISEDKSNQNYYDTLPSTTYRGEYNGESSNPIREPKQRYYTYEDFQLYDENSNLNTPRTMTPLFPSREPSIYKDSHSLPATSNNIARTSLKFEDLTINHPMNTNSVN